MTDLSPLTNLYRHLDDRIDTVYVIPDIHRYARHNPYLALLYAPLQDSNADGRFRVRTVTLFSPGIVWRRWRGEHSVVHHHWFEAGNPKGLVNAVWKLLMAALYRRAGGQVVWTVHNLEPHHGRWTGLNRFLRRRWAAGAARLCVHCGSVSATVAAHLGVPESRIAVIAHPVYPVPTLGKEAARAVAEQTLGGPLPDAPLRLMAGQIAAYKGIAGVIEAFLDAGAPGTLVIAGPLKRGEAGYLKRLRALAAPAGEHIRIHPHRLSSEALDALHTVSDQVVFNHRDILQSGFPIMFEGYRTRE